MKKIIPILSIPFLLASGGCGDYDDSLLWDELRKLQDEQKRITTLQETMNTNITTLQSLVEVLQNNDYVTGVTPFEEPVPGGYHISFTKSERATIWNGAKGETGNTGETPQIGVKQDEADEKYYWTLDGEWLLGDDDKKIPVTGNTPQLRINSTTNEWEVCTTGTCLATDNSGWTSTDVNATGDQGPQGDAIFALNGVDDSHTDYVEFTLADGVTTIKLPKYKAQPRLLTFGFKAADNPLALVYDVAGVVEDSVIKVQIPHVMTSGKNLVPYFTAEGEIFIDDELQQSGVNSVDFSSLVRYTVRSLGGEKRYTVQVSSFTGLPMVFINTEDDKPIDSKNDYVKASIRIVGASNIDDFSCKMGDVKIKGRGNSTWTLPKKPYKMKFEKKTSLLGEPKDKEWVLLANYADKTSLRNETAFFMGRLSENLAWTPRTHFVEVFLNEVYNGTYQLCEQIKIADDRVNVPEEGGYLLEVDQLARLGAEDVYFQTNRLLFNIKEPEMETNDAQYTRIKNYVAEVENLLYASNFNPETGYAQYVDIPSFVDWYLINEITKNNDAIMFSSCYLNIAPDGKLKMGPLWDFDIAIGNVNYNTNENPTGFYVANAPWFVQLMKDPAFVEQVKERFAYFKLKKTDILANINSKAAYLKYSIIENNNRWKTLYVETWPNYAVWGAYENEVQYMKNWLDTRFDWLEQEFAKM